MTTERQQMNLRLDRELLEQLDALAQGQHVDRSELVRQLLDEGVARHRIDLAVTQYAAGRVSAWRAAELAGVSLYEMLDRIAEVGIPYQLDAGVLEAIDAADGPDDPPAGSPDTESGIDRLRERFRPDRVRILFVGESSPSGGTHFYRANSNLFRATREAFVVALGPSAVPAGEAFLALFADRGCWLVDLADRPVDRLKGRPRSDYVDDGIARLTAVLEEARPARVIAVKSTVAGAVRQAARLAGYDDRLIDVLPFPLYQWRTTYISQLAAVLCDELGDGQANGPKGQPPGERHAPLEPDEYAPLEGHAAAAPVAVAEVAAPYGERTLHEAIAEVLRARGNRWTPASTITAEIARLDLFRRPSDGDHPPASQISARVRSYPRLFQVSDEGIRLRKA